MGHHKTISGSTRETPTQVIANYHVTGNPSPDCKCNYYIAGTYGGIPYSKRSDGLWYIWWNGPGTDWRISRILSVLGTEGWYREGVLLLGVYTPYGTATGNPLLSLGPH